jgi:integrase
LNKDFVTHKFKEYIRAASLPEHHTLHSLRHTYATYLRQKGVPLDIIYRLLGHSSPVVTSEHYDHTIAIHFRQQADLVDFEGEIA